MKNILVHYRIFNLLLIISIIFSIAISACGNANESDGQTVNKTVLIILFDPTIYDKTEQQKFKAWLTSFKTYYNQISENTYLVFRIIKPKIFNTIPEYERWFGINTDFYGEQAHLASLQDSFFAVQNIVIKSWDNAHSRPHLPTSCILSSLYTAYKDVNERFPPNEYRRSLVLISDMLEACNEWGSFINLEISLEEFQNLALKIDLSTFNKIAFIRIPSKNIRTPIQDNQLEKIWKKLLVNNCNANIKSIYYGFNFPSQY